MNDLRQFPNYALFLKAQGWKVEKVKNCQIFIRQIPLTPFFIVKIQRPKIIPFEEITKLSKKYRFLVVYIEPSNPNQKSSLLKYGFKPVRSSFLPTKTVQLDLIQSEKKLFQQMKKDARYEIRKTENNLLQLIKVTILSDFASAWKKSINWRRWTPSLKSLENLQKTFGQKVLFLGVGEPLIAGVVILIASKTAYYYYAFTSKKGRNLSAQYFLVWEAIKNAKKLGCQIFDFEGIFDKRFPQKSWRGFSHFKKSFGGKEKEYLGTFRRTFFLF